MRNHVSSSSIKSLLSLVRASNEDPSVIGTDGQTPDGLLVFGFNCSWFRLPVFIDCFAGGPQQNTPAVTARDEQGPVVRELDDIDSFIIAMVTNEVPAIQWLRRR